MSARLAAQLFYNAWLSVDAEAYHGDELLAELEFENVGSCGGRKNGDPEKNPRTKGENQQQTQPTNGT